jgi:hypothetical protein
MSKITLVEDRVSWTYDAYIVCSTDLMSSKGLDLGVFASIVLWTGLDTMENTASLELYLHFSVLENSFFSLYCAVKINLQTFIHYKPACLRG